MHKLLLVVIVATLARVAASQAVFEGTWKLDWSQTTLNAKPSQQLLRDGKYTCDPCGGSAWSIPADGADHPVSVIQGANTVAIQVINETQIHETNKLDGKVAWSADIKLLPDGKTRVVSWPQDPGDGKPAKTASYEETRVSPAPAGAHAVSGKWVMTKAPPLPEEDMIITFKMDGDQLICSDTKKVVYRAKLNGADVAFDGDPPGSTVAVKLIDADTLEETYKKDGNVSFVSRMTVRKDGKTMDATNTEAKGGVMKMVAFKQ